MNHPQDGSDNPIITQFKPGYGQWGLDDDNIKRIDPQTGKTILHNYCKYVNSTPIEVFKYLIETKGCDVNLLDNKLNTPLYYTFEEFKPNNGGNIATLIYLLNQNDVNVNIRGQNGHTLLHFACEKINILPIEIFKLLIETHCADVNILNKINNTPLHYAIRNFNPKLGGDITILTYLFHQKGLDGNIKDRLGRTLLQLACEYINIIPLEIFKLLIEIHHADLNSADNYFHTPIYSALEEFNQNDGGDVNVLIYLLNQNGINVNIKGQYSRTLLHWACININKLPVDAFKCLIETQCCDVNTRDKNNHTPIYYAFDEFIPDHDHDHGDDDDDDDNNNNNNNKNDCNNIKVLMYLLNQNNIDINITDCSIRSLLHQACFNINTLPLDVFKLLIEKHSSNVNIQDKNNDTPIHHAVRSFEPDEGGDITILMYLLNNNRINVNIENDNGYTLLHEACIKINKLPIDIFKLLIEIKGADINLQDGFDHLPIHIALRYFKPNNNGGNIDTLTYLLCQEALNINNKDEYGRILLHLACKYINTLPIDVFKYLIEVKHADINAQDNSKNTPLCYAMHVIKPGSNFTVLSYLLNHNGLNIHMTYRLGRNILHLACIRDLSGSGDGRNINRRGHYTVKDETNGEIDTLCSKVIEIMAERCLQEVFDGILP
jgi:ankyrin repeat protein